MSVYKSNFSDLGIREIVDLYNEFGRNPKIRLDEAICMSLNKNGEKDYKLLNSRLGMTDKYDGETLSTSSLHKSSDILGAFQVCVEVFKNVVDAENVLPILFQTGLNLDLDASRVCKIGDKVVGTYLLSSKDCSYLPYELMKKNFNGLSGDALAILPEYRGMGIGKAWRAMPSLYHHDEYDYVWGYQLKSLNNIDDWLKRRYVIGETDHAWITAEPISQTAITAFEEYLGPHQKIDPNL